jgi:hypothetical protein
MNILALSMELTLSPKGEEEDEEEEAGEEKGHYSPQAC